MDFIAGPGYAIGDDGTALRTDDGGASWTGLATGTSQDLSRLQAVTPDVVVVLGGDGCVVRRSDDGGATFHKMFVLAETNCPDRVAASPTSSRPQVGYLLLRDGNVLRTTDGGQTFGRGTAVPGTPASAARRPGHPRRRDLHHDRRRHRLPQRHQHGVQDDRRGRLLDARPGDRPRQRHAHAARSARPRSTPSARTRCCAPSDGGVTWQKRAGQRRQHDHRHRLRDRRRLPALHRQGDKLLRTEDGGATSTPITASTAPIYAAGFANADPRGRARLRRRDRRLRRQRQELRADRRRHRGLVPVRPAARPGARDRARARRPRPARPHDRQRRDLEGDQRRDLRRHAGHVVHRPPTTATRSTSAAASSAPPTAARAGSRSTRARRPRPRP